ncbi:MAG: hypothetical protein ACLFU8_02860 [Anaerolineales bacterium]
MTFRRLLPVALLSLAVLVAGCAPQVAPQPGRLYVLRRVEGSWALTEIDLEGQSPRLLLPDVRGYAPGPTAFAVVTEDGVLALWDGGNLRELYTCVVPCHDLAWSADGRYLAWTEGEYGALEARVLALRAREVTDLGAATARPTWSPAGARLALPTPEGLLFWEPGDASPTLPLSLEGPVSWSPDGNRLAALLAPGGTPVLVEPEVGLPQPRGTFTAALRFSAVAWRPGGESLALLGQRFNPPEHDHDLPHDDRPGAESVGPQPWLLDPAGALAALPGDPSAAFARPVWSPDGRYLALVRLPVEAPGPEVWVVDVDADEVVLRVPDTALPAWGH